MVIGNLRAFQQHEDLVGNIIWLKKLKCHTKFVPKGSWVTTRDSDKNKPFIIVF